MIIIIFMMIIVNITTMVILMVRVISKTDKNKCKIDNDDDEIKNIKIKRT